MKKTYSAPHLYAESFTVTEHIASGCSYPTNHSTCPIVEPDGSGSVLFANSASGCGDDVAMIWQLAGITNPTYSNLRDVNTEGTQLCYNSFNNYEILVTS